MSRLILFSVATLLSIVCPFVASAQSSMSFADKKVFNNAIDLADHSNNRAAIGLLRTLYEKYPDDPTIAYNLGICYINASGNPDSTIFFLNRVQELAPQTEWSEQRVITLLATARAQQLCARPQEALKIYDEIDSNDPQGLFSEVTTAERQACQTAQILMSNPVRLTMRTAGDGVNSPWNDYRPVLSASEDTMFFTSRRPKKTADKNILFEDGQFEEGVYMSVRNGNKWDGGNWGDATPVNGLVPGRRGKIGQETATSLSADGNEMYLCHDGDIYLSKRDNKGEWQPAEPLPYPVNTDFNENWAYISPDGQELFISSDRPEGYGGMDIWLARRLPDGSWAIPVNLGPGVNTEEDEDAPFFHAPTNVLYFCSTGHDGMGGFDIFYSPRNANGEFVASKNMGYPINSADDDLYFSPSADHDRGYYASIRWNQEGKAPSYDIYEVEFEQPEQNTMAILASNVKGADPSDVRIYTISDDNIIGVCRPNSKTGSFVSIVTAGQDVELMVVCDADTIRRQVRTLKSQSFYVTQQPIALDDFVFVSHASTTPEDASTPVSNDFPVDETLPYTVQIMSLRKHIDPSELDGTFNSDSIKVYDYRDGWHVYTFGNYSTLSEARKSQEQIRKSTYCKDAFPRAKKQYEKFVK